MSVQPPNDRSAAARRTNRLARETSPYLLQHATNPVDWYPWGGEAFARAHAEDKPIFLSVGYSTCHWCHVMEHESFENAEIAAFLNARFVSIKVDREERPDVDGIYMAAVQAMSGHGGWPMSVFLTPDKLPFFAGTYFPPVDGARGARMGFLSILRRLDDVWRNERPRVLESAAEIGAELNAALRAPRATDGVELACSDKLVQMAAQRYDARWGGLAPAPKFPSSFPLRALLRIGARTEDARLLSQAEHTFLRMADGGLYDHVGGGFHRYSTDERWLVPHFEKMLYDNALLVLSALEIHQVTGRPRGATVARDVLTWVEREMTSPDGGFYSATDADSVAPNGELEEGWFFTWSPEELRTELAGTLDASEIDRLLAAWAVSTGPNFEGRSVLWRPGAVDAETEALLERERPPLLRARGERPAPRRDDKVIASWNGLMISAFARAGLVLGERRYVDAAARAAALVLGRMMTADGRLQRTLKDGSARHAGMLEDHAFVIQGLLDLWEAGAGTRYLDGAIALEGVVAAHFEDAEHGGFFLAPDDGEALLAREKPAHDGAEPSGNSVHALNLLRLAATLEGTPAAKTLRERAERTMRAFGQVLARFPLAMSELVVAVEWLRDAPMEIVVVTPDADPRGADALLAPLQHAFVPHRVILRATETEARALAEELPLLASRPCVDGRPTVYVCRGGTCRLPASTVDGVARALEATRDAITA